IVRRWRAAARPAGGPARPVAGGRGAPDPPDLGWGARVRRGQRAAQAPAVQHLAQPGPAGRHGPAPQRAPAGRGLAAAARAAQPRDAARLRAQARAARARGAVSLGPRPRDQGITGLTGYGASAYARLMECASTS